MSPASLRRLRRIEATIAPPSPLDLEAERAAYGLLVRMATNGRVRAYEALDERGKTVTSLVLACPDKTIVISFRA